MLLRILIVLLAEAQFSDVMHNTNQTKNFLCSLSFYVFCYVSTLQLTNYRAMHSMYMNISNNKQSTFLHKAHLYTLSYSTIVLYSRDNKGVGVAHKIISPKKQPQFPLTTMKQY